MHSGGTEASDKTEAVCVQYMEEEGGGLHLRCSKPTAQRKSIFRQKTELTYSTEVRYHSGNIVI